MQAIYNTQRNTLTIQPGAPVDAGTFSRLRAAGFTWRADVGAFIAENAAINDDARAIAADIAGPIEFKPGAWVGFSGDSLAGFPRAELFIKSGDVGCKLTHAGILYTRGAGEHCNAAALQSADEDETITPSGEDETTIPSGEDEDDDAAAPELCDDIERATYSPEDNKIRLYPVRRLDADLYKQVKAAGFSWAPKQGVFVAPMWTPGRADLAESLAGELGDEDTTLAERAEDRAERFEDYQGKRAADANQARRAVSAISEHIPLGQPILIGHHSEKRARRDAQRIEDGMRRAVKMWETSEYWERRAAGAIAHAKYKELPAVRARRIKTIEAAQRKTQKTVDTSARFLAHWRDISSIKGMTNKDGTPTTLEQRAQHVANVDRGAPWGIWSALDKGTMTGEQAQAAAIAAHEATAARCARWLAHYANRLAYERAMLAESGGLESDKVKPEKGGAIRCLWGPRGGWSWIVKVNRVTVTVLHNYGNNDGRNFKTNVPLDKIREVMSAADVEAARAAGRLVETADKIGFYLAEPTPPETATPAAETVPTSGEDSPPPSAPSPSSERAPKIKTTEHKDRDGKTRVYLAGVPKGCDALHPLVYASQGVAESRAAKLRAAGIAASVRGSRIEIDPSGEVAAEPACLTLIPGRWVHGGAENAERIAVDIALGVEVWLTNSTRSSGACAVIAYHGKRAKHDAHYTMATREKALQWAAEYLEKHQARAREQAERKAEQAAKRAAGHKLQVGDVLRSSWGYDQTNIDFYEVTKLIGKRMVEIRELSQEREATEWAQGKCVPVPGAYIGEPMRKTVSDSGDSVRIASYAGAYKIEPTMVAGVKVYPVSHWTAYA